jgi:hypothetical protein
MSLNRQQILGQRKRKVRRVDVPEWAENGAGHVYVRELSAAEAARIAGIDEGDTLAALVQSCILGVCNHDGIPLFTDADREAIGDLGFGPLQRCVETLMELNEIGGEGAQRRKKD